MYAEKKQADHMSAANKCTGIALSTVGQSGGHADRNPTRRTAKQGEFEKPIGASGFLCTNLEKKTFLAIYLVYNYYGVG